MYHISRHYLGASATFTPRVPVQQNAAEEKLPPRICASPTVEQCWNALKGCNDMMREMRFCKGVDGFYFFIYKMDESTFSENKDVLDFALTNEHISLVPVKAELVECIYIKSARMHFCLSFDSIREDATIEEAASAYKEWQKDEIYRIEDLIDSI